ncbi:XRE family transcriptional regulator [Staphylococcus saprophyticus]|uniref:XRE family transcriptional regulator n=1 Tax=Staphylococcus saprophyticus TaxID=29385 RepID=UPI0034DD435E
MYPRLSLAMKDRNVKEKDIAKLLNIPYTTVRDRTKGTYSFTFEQALLIQREFFPSYSIEELFDVKHST